MVSESADGKPVVGRQVFLFVRGKDIIENKVELYYNHHNNLNLMR